MGNRATHGIVAAIITLSILVSMIAVPSGIAQAASPNISYGDRVAVTWYGDGVAVRDCASTSCDPPVWEMPAGFEGEVKGGPQYNGGYKWWYIEWVNNKVGWTAEASLGGIAYLQPLPGGGKYPNVTNNGLSYRVRVYDDIGTTGLCVRTGAGLGYYCDPAKKKYPGSKGWTTAGPVVSQSEELVWWYIEWDNSDKGWSADSRAYIEAGVYLVKEGSTPLPSAGDVSVTTYSATSIGQTQATLRGAITDFNNNSAGYIRFGYRPSGGSWSYTSWVYRTTTTAYSQTVYGLSPNTNYEFYAQAYGAEDTTIDTGDTLTFHTASTPSELLPPTNPRPGETTSPGPVLDSSTVTLQWDASVGATRYALGVVNCNTGILEVDTWVDGISYPVTLQPNTPYRWNVAAWNDAGYSSFTALRYFQTPSGGVDLVQLIQELTIDSISVIVDEQSFRILTLEHKIDVSTKEVIPGSGLTKVYVDANGELVSNVEIARKIGQIDLAREESPSLMETLETLEALKLHKANLESLDNRLNNAFTTIKVVKSVDDALNAALQIIDIQMEIVSVQIDVFVLTGESSEAISILGDVKLELASYRETIIGLDKATLTVKAVQAFVPKAIAFIFRLVFHPMENVKNDLSNELNSAIDSYKEARDVLAMSEGEIATYADAHSFRHGYLYGKPHADNALFLARMIFGNYDKALIGLGVDLLLSAVTGGAWALKEITVPVQEAANDLKWTMNICYEAVLGRGLAACKLAYELSASALYTMRLGGNGAQTNDLIKKASACETEARNSAQTVYDAVVDYFGPINTILDFWDWLVSGIEEFWSYVIHSPGELQIYNDEGLVTGLVNGEVRQEIPNALYDAVSNGIVLFSHSEPDSYRCCVVGTAEGRYGLGIEWDDLGEVSGFAVVDVETWPTAVHNYTIDWDTLAKGESGITIEKDYDGDGEVDEIIITGIPETPTYPSPLPNSANVPPDKVLSWTGDDSDSVTYNIYLGNNATSLQLVSERQVEKAYVPMLEPNTTYYWRVAAINEHNICSTGSVWVFATGESGLPFPCFIATAAYGTPMEEEVQVLREFRDTYLAVNPIGRALTDIYYRVSPPMAKFIIEHPSLKPIVRTGLLPAVAMSTVIVNTTVAEKIAILGLFTLAAVAVAILVTRRRHRGSQCS